MLKIFKKHYQLLLILLFATLLRFKNIELLTTFSGDQGFDFLKIKEILEGNLTLLGPKIGPYNQLGNLYLGPAYYYLLAPFLLIFRFDPIGPAYLTALLAVATVFLMYCYVLENISKKAAIISALFYSLDPFLIDQSRAASNPHLIPFFSILSLFSYSKSISNKKNIWPIICGISLGIIFQLHYLGFVLILIYLFHSLHIKNIKNAFTIIVSAIASISGQIFFEITHKYFITNLFIKQFLGGEATNSLSGVINRILESIIFIFRISFGNTTIGVVLIFLFGFLIVVTKPKITRVHYWLLILPVVSTLLFVSLYSGPVQTHYFSIIYPQLFIILGFIVSLCFASKNQYLKAIGITFCLIFITSSLTNLNLARMEGYTMPNGWNLVGQKKSVELIKADEDSSFDFNVASVLDGDTRAMPIRYLLSTNNKHPLGVETYPSSKTIYLISRDNKDTILKYSVWEVSSFSPFNVINLGEIQNGIFLYKLKKT